MSNIQKLTFNNKRLALGRAVVCFALLPILFSCKKEPIVGDEVQPGSGHSELQVEEGIPVIAYSEFQGPLRSDESISLLGTMNDPYFGTAEASFYTTIEFPGTAITDSAFDGAIADSVYFTFLVESVYGNKSHPQEVHMFRLTEGIDATVDYTSDKQLAHDNAPLAAFTLQFSPTAVPGVQKIALPQAFAQEILDKAGEAFTNQTTFAEWFTGLYVTTVGAAPSAEEKGAVYRINLASEAGLSIYYHTAKDTLALNFDIGSSTPRFNQFFHDYTGSKASENIAMDAGTQQTLFLEGMAGAKVQLEIPELASFVQDQNIINRAVISFEPDASYEAFEPSAQLYLVRVNDDGEMFFLEDLLTNSQRFGGKLVDGRYEFDITRHVQTLVENHQNGQAIKTSFELLTELPAVNGNVANRTVLKGSKNISLKIYYTPVI